MNKLEYYTVAACIAGAAACNDQEPSEPSESEVQPSVTAAAHQPEIPKKAPPATTEAAKSLILPTTSTLLPVEVSVDGTWGGARQRPEFGETAMDDKIVFWKPFTHGYAPEITYRFVVDYMKDPAIKELAEKFRGVAKVQAARVKTRGGFCNVPILQGVEVYDDRLGDELRNIVAERNKIFKSKYPDLIYPSWEAELGRVVCESVGRPQVLEDAIPDKKKRKKAEAQLDELRKLFNRKCAFDQGGLTKRPDVPSDLELLRRRADVLLGAVKADFLKTVTKDWRESCTPGESTDKPLSPQERRELGRSHFLVDRALSNHNKDRSGGSDGHKLICPDVDITSRALNYCGKDGE